MILQITLAVLKLNKVMNIYGVVLLEYVLFLLLLTRKDKIFRKTTCMIRTQNKARNALGVIWSNDIVCMMPGVGAIRHD